jgi:HJR/Mrr/RecB family endonuclease
MPQTRQGGLKLRSNFNGIIKEILEQYPNIDLAGYLADNLQLPMDKAEVLAGRIEKQILQKALGDKEVKTLRLLEKTAEEEEQASTGNYPVDVLSAKEFEYFIRWLLGELGYEAQPENYAATEYGVDGVAVKDGEKVAVEAIRCPKTHRITDPIIRIAQEKRGDCPKALVITAAAFTDSAKAEAEKVGIELWDCEVLQQKIKEAKNRVDLDVQVNFPKYQGNLFSSLLALGETKNFLVESKAEGKYEVNLPGVKYPLLTFQVQNGKVTRCVQRIKYNEPVNEADGEVIAVTDEEQGYGLVMQYLELFVE